MGDSCKTSTIKFFHSGSKFAEFDKEKIYEWSLKLNKQKFGAMIRFPEGLENTPFKVL